MTILGSIRVCIATVALLAASTVCSCGRQASGDDDMAEDAGAPAGATAAGATTPPAMPEDATIWTTKNGGNGHGYLLVTHSEGVTWTEADAAARAAGGHLVTITSAAENAFVLGLVNSVESAWVVFPPSTVHLGPWLGATADSGTWSWVTDETWAYTAWVIYQPTGTSEAGDVEDKLQLLAMDVPTATSDVGWNDATNWGGPSYVIEFE